MVASSIAAHRLSPSGFGLARQGAARRRTGGGEDGRTKQIFAGSDIFASILYPPAEAAATYSVALF